MTTDLKKYIRDIPDFPKKGIVFKDISPLLRDANAFRHAIESMADVCEREGFRPDLCAGPEARGFIFAATLANFMGIGFVPIRKPGKLPAATTSVEYQLEYGTDRVEMHVDAMERGQRVLLVDDVLATGGTIRACADLVEKSGALLCGILFAVELRFLAGRERLGSYPAFSLIEY